MEESRGNGRYYWKDSSLVGGYCNWYSCDRFNRCFLLRFIFWVGFISLVIG
uniref:photosystem II protein J n=1 Tax=Pommereschea lackneri TaxID=110731 RepID=UPI001EDF40C9|nr:photosystem II protein J [Pommereschea lackneri]UKE75710.1 photosystem II protein J [Pommereschea lackneri]